MKARIGLGLVLAVAVALVAALPAMAITKNYQQDFDHPFVGLIVFYAPDGTIDPEKDGRPDFSHRCSGSLIDETTFVTAGHCTDDENGGVMTSARIWFNQSGGSAYDPDTTSIRSVAIREMPRRSLPDGARDVQLRLRRLRRLPGHT